MVVRSVDVGISSLEGLLSNLVPDSAEQDDAKIEDRLSSLTFPPHARQLQALREDRFASGLRNTAANRQVVIAILVILHLTRSCSKVFAGRAEVRLAFLAQLSTCQHCCQRPGSPSIPRKSRYCERIGRFISI